MLASLKPPDLRPATDDLLPSTEPESNWDAVLAQAKRHDLGPLGPFLVEVFPRLLRAASGCVPYRFRHALLALDLVQDAMVRIFEHIESFPGHTKTDFLRSLCRVVRNNAHNTVRDLMAKKRGAGHTVSYQNSERPLDMEDVQQARAAMAADRQKTIDSVWDLFLDLPLDERSLLLGWLLGYSLAKLARGWRISVDAVHKRLDSSFALLRKRAHERGLGNG